MYDDILIQAGLTQNEAKIYQVILENNQLSVTQISKISNIHRRNVYDAIERLIDKGLAFQLFNQFENHYKAVDPHKLIEIIKEKENKLNSILPELEKKYYTKPVRQSFFIYKGVQGFKNYLMDIVKSKADIYSIGEKGIWFDKKIKNFFNSFQRQIESSQGELFFLYDDQAIRQIPNVIQGLGSVNKKLPKAQNSNTTCHIYSDRVVTLNHAEPAKLDDDIVIYIQIDQNLVDSYKKWFNFIWHQL